MSVTPQSLPIPQTQVPSAPSSSLCPEKNSEKASEAISEWLHWPYPTTRKPWCTSNRVALCLGYPVHRSLPPTRRSSSDESLLPGEAQDKPPKLHAKLSLLRATRIVPAVTTFYVFDRTAVVWIVLAVVYMALRGDLRDRDLRGPPLYSGLGDCPNNLILSFPSPLKLSVRHPTSAKHKGWHTVASYPSISPRCGAPSTFTQA
jgi:hypothetical protein